MVDELIMPEFNYHQQWSKELKQLQNHIEAQTGKPHFWIACAGIKDGKTEHFTQSYRSYLTLLLPPVFHILQMDLPPLHNTKQVLAMAGIERKEFLYNNQDDADELACAVEAACKEVFGRTGGAGFPILCDGYAGDSKIRIVKRGVERAGTTALIYHSDSHSDAKVCCSEGEVEEWLRRRRSGKEKRVLLLDENASRGWEASHVLVVNLLGVFFENLVMRAVGYCALVKQK